MLIKLNWKELRLVDGLYLYIMKHENLKKIFEMLLLHKKDYILLFAEIQHIYITNNSPFINELVINWNKHKNEFEFIK